MLIVLIAAPLAILLIGPIGIGSVAPFRRWFTPFMVIWAGFSRHYGRAVASAGNDRDAPRLTPTIIQTIAETGKEGMVMPQRSALTCRWAVHHWQWRGKRKPGTASDGAGCGGISHYGGVSEPALYGVAIRLKRPLIASLSAVLFAARLPVWRGLPATHGSAGAIYQRAVLRSGESNELVWVFAVMALAVVLSFILTLCSALRIFLLRKRLLRRESIRRTTDRRQRSKS